MIKLPFKSSEIPTTLEFSQIIQRLESAIYDPKAHSAASQSVPSDYKYIGEIKGFKFLATPLLGSKYLHLPTFLSPSLEGRIYTLSRGHAISLSIKLHTLTFVLFLACIGGLLTSIASVLESIADIGRSWSIAETFSLVSATLLGYFYYSAWRGTKFFKALFAKGFDPSSSDLSAAEWYEDRERKHMSAVLSKNLPSLDRSRD